MDFEALLVSDVIKKRKRLYLEIEKIFWPEVSFVRHYFEILWKFHFSVQFPFKAPYFKKNYIEV